MCIRDRGMAEPSILSMFYVVVMAPLAEELLMRGLCLKILERSFPFWAANFLQALFFGLYHMNLIQGCYAFLMGLILGRLVKKYGTLKASMLCHFIINFSGQVISVINFSVLGIFLGTLVCAGVLVVLYIWEKRKNEDYPVSYTHLDVYKRQGLISTASMIWERLLSTALCSKYSPMR